MAKTDIEIIIKAIVDQAIDNIKKTDKAVEDLGKSGNKGKSGVTDFSSSVVVLNQALELGMKVYEAAKRIYDETVGSAKNLADEIRELTRVTGDNAETASRMRQVADDVGLSFDNLKTSLVIAAKQGIDVSWESIKRMAGEYQALPSQIDKVNYVTKIFGRNGEELAKVLELDAVQLQKMADGAEKALVLNEALLKQSKANDILKDRIKDSTDAIKVQAGQQIIGIENAQLMNQAITAQAQAELAAIVTEQGHGLSMEQVNKFYAERYPLIRNEIQAELDAQIATANNAAAASNLSIQLQNANQATKDLEEAQKSLLEKTAGQFEGALRGAGVEGEKLLTALGKLDEVYGTQTKANQELQTKIKEAAETYAKTGDIEAWGKALSGVKDQVLGPLNQQIENNKTKIKELNDELTKLNGKKVEITVHTTYTTSGVPVNP